MQWAGRTNAAFDEAEIAEAYPEFRAQREMRERMARLVDRVMIAARFDKDTKRADEIIDAGTRQAWAEAPSFWRGTSLDELEELAKTGKIGASTKKRDVTYEYTGISSDQAEAKDFGKSGVVLELDSDAIRAAEGTDAFRVNYMVNATVAPGRL